MTVEFRKDLFADERDDDLNEIGKPTRRQDILGHVTGRSPYYDDHLFEGLLHLKCARSPHHHARIRAVDTSAAERMPGVVRVVTGRDVPVNMNTLLSLLDFGRDDEPTLATEKVGYRGEPVVAVIAETERQAREAAAAVVIDWEPLPHVLTVEEALAPDAPVVNEQYPDNTFDYHDRYDHQKLRYGDVEAALARAEHVVEGRYSMSPIEQAPMETCGAIAAPETNDRWVCYSSTQGLFFSLGTSAKILDVSSARLHFIGGTVGGGFGGKVDSLNEPLAILGAMLTGRPVKYTFDRAEEMQVGAPRGAEVWHITDAIGADGRILARRFVGYFDSGAYTRLSSYAVQKAVGHLPGPYTIPNVWANVYCVYTNRTPSTAMRGFGITGVDFAIERHMDKGARAAGMDPLAFRILNAYRDGDMKAHRRLAKNCALIECAQVVADKTGWPLGEDDRRMSSMTGGGGARGAIPNHTATDDDGRIGERRRGGGGTAPARPPARAPAAAAPAPARPGPSGSPASPARAEPSRPAAAPSRPEPMRPAASAPSADRAAAARSSPPAAGGATRTGAPGASAGGTVGGGAGYAGSSAGGGYGGSSAGRGYGGRAGRSAPSGGGSFRSSAGGLGTDRPRESFLDRPAPTPSSAEEPRGREEERRPDQAREEGEPYRPSEPFTRGVKRPGGGRFSSVSGTRRR